MTRAIYEQLTRASRIKAQKIPNIVMMAQHKNIETAAESLAKVVHSLTPSELAEASSNMSILKSLDEGSTFISETLNDNTMIAIEKSFAIGSETDRAFMIKAGLEPVQVDGIILEVNRRLLETTINRTYQDGYNFSTRIWRAGKATQNDIKKVLDLGIANNRDPFQVARDIQTYVADGKVKLMKSYGKLKQGTAEFANRIPEDIDYRAMRIVKTETYTSLRDTELLSGEANPGTTGFYRWVLNVSRGNWECGCPDLASGGPYTFDTVPSNPHPNCSCYLQAVLRDQREFISDLQRWISGDSVPYLDDWAASYKYKR